MLGHSIVSQNFMEPIGSIPNSQEDDVYHLEPFRFYLLIILFASDILSPYKFVAQISNRVSEVWQLITCLKYYWP
jgi:hypothetical protein